MKLNIEDFGALRRYLMKHVYSTEPVSIKPLHGGVSNRTVQVTWRDRRAWVLKQALEKLRVKEDWYSSPERIHVEAKALRWLNRLTPAGMTPTFIFEDPPNHLLAIEAVPEGHENWKTMLLSGRVVSNYFDQFGFLLGTIHRRSAEAGSELRQAFADTRYFESLRLDPYYGTTARKAPTVAEFLNVLSRDTLRKKLSLVHGDFSPKNVLIHQNRLVLLDYEVVHFGDPAFDVGFALTHFLSKANHLVRQRAALAEGGSLFWKSYAKEVKAAGWTDLEPRSVRHTMACLLARVLGKSPLEYLTGEEARRQCSAVIRMIAEPPTTVSDLISRYLREIEAHGKN